MFNFKKLVFFLLIVAGFGACNKSDTGLTGAPNLDSDGSLGSNGNLGAKVTIIHAAAGAPAFDIMLDKNRLNVLYFNYTDRVKYINAFAGNNNFQVLYPYSNSAILNKQMSFEAGKSYSVFIADTASKMDVFAINDNMQFPGGDSVQIRFVNMSPNAPALNLIIQGEKKPVASNINYKKAGGFFSYPAAKGVVFEIRTAQNKLMATTEAIDLSTKDFYTVWCGGYVNGNASKNTLIRLNTYAHYK